MRLQKEYVNCFAAQCSILWKSLGVKLVLSFITGLVVYNYILNISYYYGADVNNLPQPMLLNMLSLEKERGIAYFFLQLFPFLVVIPCGFSYIDDINHGTINYYRFRISKKAYLFSKAFAVFLITFLVFEIPQILEIVLNAIAFPVKESGSPSGMSMFQQAYIEQVKEYFLYGIFVKHPYIYALCMTLKLSVFAGVMSLFSLAFSLFGIKIKVFLFLPSYILLYGLGTLDKFFNLPFQVNYYYYIFNYVAFKNLNFFAFGVFLLGLLVFANLIFVIYSKKEDL